MPNFATWSTCANINTSVHQRRPCCQRPPNSATAQPHICTRGEPTRVASHSSHLAKTRAHHAKLRNLVDMRQHQHQRPPASPMLPTTAKLRHSATTHLHSRGTNPRGLPFVPSRENSRTPCQTSQLGRHAPTSTPASTSVAHAANDRQTPPQRNHTSALAGNQPAWPPIRPISRKLAHTMPNFATWSTCANINTSVHQRRPCCQRPPNSATAQPHICTRGEPTRVASHSSHLAKTRAHHAKLRNLVDMRQHQHQRPPASPMLPTIEMYRVCGTNNANRTHPSRNVLYETLVYAKRKHWIFS
uniref:Uncharacterized protein n=1 Tax=Globisporangium ultimum (strain ATCC 200006 / CBS 805.95 / DAOM BR144) TaxID=431595 RepID=K3XCS4_GLOUD